MPAWPAIGSNPDDSFAAVFEIDFWLKTVLFKGRQKG
jgi:hypothetical protein